MSARTHPRQRSLSNQRPAQAQLNTWKGKENALTSTNFEPCAATGSLFLYAEGPTVICLHHDTLAVERVFEKHTEDIQFICVDNVSERGQGRLVVTYDVGQTAIVWDLLTGEQLSRFASFDPLTVAAWMRNGNLTFGNEKGDLILFEPSTSEHVSARTIFDPVTAIAPSADCKTFAIGYRNGSILLATLQPIFTILHTLSTPRAPSQISALSWHASSSKQKSDMLATNTIDGDLRVWSVAKPPGSSQPRIIRSLHRSDSFAPSQSWITWSKNGRILQLYDGVTWSWDVRTKDVTYHSIPTVEYIKGIAAYGPTGTLFTLGPDHTVQQYDVDIPQMVANVRHPPRSVQQTPPQGLMPAPLISKNESGITLPRRELKFDNNQVNTEHHRRDAPHSTHRRTRSQGSQPTEGQPYEVASPGNKTERTATTISLGAQSQPADPVYSPASNRSARKQSRLRQEIALSPIENTVLDLFPFTRARLSDVPYQQPKAVDESSLTPDDLRKQMLNVVFGWHGDIESLVQDELSRHSTDHPNAVFLSRWLGVEPSRIADAFRSTTFNSSLDWMRLALSCIGSQQGSKKIAQVLIQKLLARGDIHAASCLLMAIGEYNDAIEVYVSQNCHMEAILLTCLLMPSDWQRQSHLVRKWGEHVVQQSQQHLAVRCFSCTSAEPTEPWTSPTAQAATQGIQEDTILQPSIYHKTMERRGIQDPSPRASLAPPVTFQVTGPSKVRTTPQDGGLKLITSFGSKDSFKFPGLLSDEGTPINAALVTPIAESALPRSAVSPGGLGSYKMNNMRSISGALAARAGTPINSQRIRLPSIGENHLEVENNALPGELVPRAPLTPADSGSDKEKAKSGQTSQNKKVAQPSLPTLLTPARYDPSPASVGDTPQTAVAPQSNMSFADRRPLEIERPASAQPPRTSSRTRKPEGLSVSTLSKAHATQSVHEILLPSVYGETIQRPATTTAAFGTGRTEMSPPNTGNSLSSWASLKGTKSPTSASGHSLDKYISSLEQAQYYKASRSRGNSITSKQSRDDFGELRLKNTARNLEGRVRSGSHSIQHAKRSPASPVSMSPEEVRLHSASMESFDSSYSNSSYVNRSDNRESMENGTQKAEHTSQIRQQRRSRSRTEGRSQGNSRAASRHRSAERQGGKRGRSNARKEGSSTRSPESPVPMIPSEEDLQGAQSTDPSMKFVAQNRQRLNRSSSRRGSSTDRRNTRTRSRSRQPKPSDAEATTMSSTGIHQYSNDEYSDTYQAQMGGEPIERVSSTSEAERLSLKNLQHLPHGRRKQLAQAELEARRLSLTRRPSAPAVPFPGQNFGNMSTVEIQPSMLRAQTDQGVPTLSSFGLPPPSRPDSAGYVRARPQTPRAMKHPAHGQKSVPELPNFGEVLSSNVYQAPSANEVRVTSPQKGRSNSFASPEVPFDMPMHPAFDATIATSRPGSQNARAHHASPARGVSRERKPTREPINDFPVMTIGEENSDAEAVYASPPVVPELQHLAMPPPPPPPPQYPNPQDFAQKHNFMSGLRIQTEDLHDPSNVPLPQSAYPADPPTVMSPSSYHRRERSINDKHLASKIRTFAGRMRSTSRGRSQSRPRGDNSTRSPNIGSEDSISPYESINITQMTNFHLSSVADRR